MPAAFRGFLELDRALARWFVFTFKRSWGVVSLSTDPLGHLSLNPSEEYKR